MSYLKYSSLGALAAVLVASIGVLFLYQLMRRKQRKSSREPVNNYSHGSIQSLLKAYNITVVNTIDECEQFLKTRISGPVGVMGLDCEWRGPSYLSQLNQPVLEHTTVDCPVALLQLAFPNREVVLARLCCMGGVGPILRELLTDRNVLKFGVGIDNDVNRLTAAVGVVPVGCVDLQHLVVRCGIRGGGTSLYGLTLQLLGLTLDKSFHLRCGDWESEQLSHEQINYAALDAIVALHILEALVEKKKVLQYRRTNHRSHDQPTILTDQSIDSWLNDGEHYSTVHSLCQGVVDAKFKQRHSKSPRQHDGADVPKRTNAYSARTSQLYHNCQLLAPDGQLLSTMHRKKVEWYLERQLGTLVCESPLTVKLHFEPAGRPGVEREYYLHNKENICVVCGADKNCVRKNIIPHEYRRHFPPVMKEHLSHDVVLLCVTCHQRASQYSALLKQQIAAEHGLYGDISSQKFKEDPELKRLKNHARVLLKDTSNIPEKRLQLLQNSVASYYQIERDQLTVETIQDAADIDPRSRNQDYVSQSEAVVKGLIAEGGKESLVEFQQRWRQHFLDTMTPDHLPYGWSVDHNPAGQ